MLIYLMFLCKAAVFPLNSEKTATVQLKKLVENPHYYINSGLGIKSVQFMHLCIQLNTKLFLNTIWCLPTPIYFHFLFESRKSVSSHASKCKQKKKRIILVPRVLPKPLENSSTLLLEMQFPFKVCFFFCYIFFYLIFKEDFGLPSP